MSQVDTVAASDRLSESQKAALLTLLADEDPCVYRRIRDRILSYGPAATDWLRPHSLSRDPALRRRVHEILLCFDRRAADDHFLGFCLKHGQEFDLENAAWLLSLTQYPDFNVAGYHALLDSYADDLRQQMEPGDLPHQVLARLNQYLFDGLGFTGNERDYYDPDNNYLNRVLDRRTGNPVSLCLVYLLIARRLRLPVAGIGLPGHFVCRYQSSAAEFYIDAFNRGKLLTKADCIQYLVQGNYTVRDEYLAPVTPRRILLRICGNLHQIYLHLGQSDIATRLQRYLVALAR